MQRQVVLEDGRVIEEDDPEVTLDTIEDVESHSDDADDEVQQIGALVHVRYHIFARLRKCAPGQSSLQNQSLKRS